MWRRLKEYFNFIKYKPDSKILNMIADLSKINIEYEN
jgi:hypothetical protein